MIKKIVHFAVFMIVSVLFFGGHVIASGEQSHQTHLNAPKGPQISDCTDCHLLEDPSLFADGNPLTTTTVCDSCHSPGGAFDGVNDPDVGAKLNWESGIYEPAVPPEEWPSRLKAGKENWCAGCHDNGTSVVNSVSAPNLMGDNATYGYSVSGHGAYAVRCDDCHDLIMLHTDGQARTYSASSNNYREGYRLNEDMVIPRYGQYGPNAFRLCFKCHVYSDVLGAVSNFRDDNKGIYLHEQHLNTQFSGILCWDSDWNEDFNNCTQGECADSAISCTACHNVHGSPTPAMIRHGELISTPGTTDKVPALDFRWYKADGFTQTMILGESRYGGLLCGQPPYNVSFNHVCWGCHPTAEIKYYRIFPRPTIGYSPTSFRFNAIPRDRNPAKQSLHIWNAGDGTLNWSVSKNAPWLSLHPTTGTDSRTIDVLIDTRELIREGTYIATITITATGATNSPVRINVMLTIGAPVPDIRTPVTDITFADVNVGNFLDRTTTIYNDGTATLMVNSITRSSGSTEFTYVGPSTPFNIPAYGSQTVTVRFSPISAGAKTAAFNVNSNDPSDPDITFNVLGNGTPPTQVTLFSPNGGDVIPSGSTYTIQWNATPEAVKFTLKYSINNGSTWKLIAKNITGISYDWTVPVQNNNKTNCLVKVIGFNAGGTKVCEDISDSTFTIEVVKVTSPDGGDVLESGETWTLRWQTNCTIRPVANTKLFYTTNGGSTWKAIKTLTGNPGSYNWTVPNVSSSNCKVKVMLKDAGNVTVGSDVSDTNFTIQP
jgi:cytochrome c553